jgi:GTP cyclohydrolase I
VCVPGKEIVNVVGGAKPAREVLAGDRLWTLDRGFLKETEVTAVSSRKTRQIVEVTTESGRFRVTPDHPVMTEEGWREAQELKAGSRVSGSIGSLCSVLSPSRLSLDTFWALRPRMGSINRARTCLVVKSEDFAKKYCGDVRQAFRVWRLRSTCEGAL